MFLRATLVVAVAIAAAPMILAAPACAQTDCPAGPTKPRRVTACHTPKKVQHHAPIRPPYAWTAPIHAASIPTPVAHATVMAGLRSTCRGRTEISPARRELEVKSNED
jgi:hypothetical protein